VVPPSGNMTVGPQQFWLGTARAGQKVTLWIDTATLHLSICGWRIKTVPSRLTEMDLARLHRADARPAGLPPAGPSPGMLAASRCVEVDRLVNGIGGITLLNHLVLVGSPLAGQRARIRLDGQLMHVITQDGVLWRTLPYPIPPGQRHRLQGVRLAGPAPLPEPAVTVQRRVSSRGGIQVAHQRIHVGMTHAGKIVTVVPQDTASGWSSTAKPSAWCPAPPATRSTVTRPTHPPRKAVNPMPRVTLDAADATELAEMLQFPSDWLARDPARLAPSLEQFVGHPAYRTAQLRGDLARFVFLLGGDDGESLFGPPRQ
jgi:hypothetical protein